MLSARRGQRRPERRDFCKNVVPTPETVQFITISAPIRCTSWKDYVIWKNRTYEDLGYPHGVARGGLSAEIFAKM